jgi:(R)-citramalyl-CoA lyase
MNIESVSVARYRSCREMGYETGIELQALIECAAWMSEQLGKEMPGQVYKAGDFVPVAG